MENSISIRGRVAIVTGAGSGIGRGIAEVLANNGAKVVVVDKDEAKAKKTVEKLTSSSKYFHSNSRRRFKSCRHEEDGVDCRSGVRSNRYSL